jgi:hypothetical protein
LISRREPRRFRRVAVQETIEATQERIRRLVQPFL